MNEVADDNLFRSDNFAHPEVTFDDAVECIGHSRRAMAEPEIKNSKFFLPTDALHEDNTLGVNHHHVEHARSHFGHSPGMNSHPYHQ
jgi:hypothetical protein